jgi:glycosyltransferase involved in cell wall biosynthesis
MSSRTPLVSVIVPTRNSGRTLDACLNSIRSQHYQPVEVVVVDNGSTDRTLQIARDRADIVEHWAPERSAQRNRGAQVSHGDFVLFVDSDMTLSPEVVGDCMDLLRSNDTPGVIIPEISFGEGFLAHCRALERSCYDGDDTIEAARFFARAPFEAAGGYEENLVAFEDWDLSSRIAAGRHFPRTVSHITHDEGRLRLGTVLAKKRLYGRSFAYFSRRHGKSTLGQANVIFRPAFIRNWRRLFRHPLLTAGFLSLKTLEAAAGLWGLLESRAPRAGGDSGPMPNQVATIEARTCAQPPEN